MRQSNSLVRSLSGLSVLSVVAALSTYLFMAVVARQLDTSGFASFTISWSLIYTISGAVLSSAEPELTRMLVTSKWRSARKIFVRAAVLLFLSTGVFAIATGRHIDSTDVSFSALFLVIGLLFLMLLEVLARSGFASLQNRFAFGLISPLDAISRLMFVGLFIIFISQVTVEAILLAMLLGTLLTGLISIWMTRSVVAKVMAVPDEKHRMLSGHKFGYGYLLVGTVSMTALISGVPVIAGVTTNLSSSEIGTLGAALMISRVPLILIMGFESVLVQEFDSRLQASGSPKRLAQILAGVSLVCGGSGLLVGFTTGPFLVEVIAGSTFDVGNQEMALFGCAIGFLLGGILLTPLNIALGRHSKIAGVWATSLFLFVLFVGQFGNSLGKVATALTIVSFLCVSALSITAGNTKKSHIQGIK